MMRNMSSNNISNRQPTSARGKTANPSGHQQHQTNHSYTQEKGATGGGGGQYHNHQHHHYHIDLNIQ